MDREVVLFFADTGAEHPLWDEGGGLLDLDELALSGSLRDELERWADEAGWPENYLHNSEVLARLNQDGRELFRRTQFELGAGYEVRWRWLTD